MFEVLLYDVVGDVSCAPCTIADGPEMFTPVLFLKLRELLLQETGGTTFQSLHEFTDCESSWVLYVHMDMVFTDYSFEDGDVFSVTNLHDEGTTALLYVTLQYWVSVFCYPDYVYGHSSDGVAVVP